MSHRASIAAASLVGAALLLAGGALGSTRTTADFPSLYVTFHTNSTVSVALSDGTPVGTSSGPPTTISPGTYNVLIDDSSFVNDVQWDLQGPGVKLVTNMSYGEEPSETWVETFLPGSTYTYRDDMRPGTVWTFVTSNTASAGTPGSGAAPGTSTTPIPSGTNGKAPSTDVVGSGVASVLRGALTGTVSSSGKATLTQKGKPVTTLKAGRYTVTVTDSSKKAGFTIQEIKKTATTLTAGTFTGKKTVTLVLKAGQWFYYPSFVAAKTYFIVVT